ncbi:CDP-alcohol phosphatidyltransferase [Thermotomaculum hydrothermale]|uniref:CDP-alcohol phosphatidyltransferase n=1 Tax=Thermotomaculum hydrothermale TaxID=981385 RepID=A0A7R6PNN7_9BACT|nr:CDP-alcohol phosphatidyltransferase family protein [Thermotomaculum hydrothermale]BBB33427.1 CDP-alcohol phosphatidyltransferase [Thermotomaculum hydrothermale]
MDGVKIKTREVIDLSDYGRQVAIFIAKPLAKVGLKAWQVTIFHFLLMCLVGYLVYLDTDSSLALASILLLFKNIFDAVDGSIARIQKRPSKIGRFLDSNLDFLGHAILFFAIRDASFLVKLFGFLSFVFQGSVFNYYFVLFRHRNGGDKTSKIKENGENEFPYDNPFVVKALYLFYLVFYKWQDELVDFIEVKVLKCKRKTPNKTLLQLVSVFGPGFQYLFVMLFFTLGKTSLIPLFFLLPYNGLLVYAFFVRRKCRESDE